MLTVLLWYVPPLLDFGWSVREEWRWRTQRRSLNEKHSIDIVCKQSDWRAVEQKHGVINWQQILNEHFCFRTVNDDYVFSWGFVSFPRTNTKFGTAQIFDNKMQVLCFGFFFLGITETCKYLGKNPHKQAHTRIHECVSWRALRTALRLGLDSTCCGLCCSTRGT